MPRPLPSVIARACATALLLTCLVATVSAAPAAASGTRAMLGAINAARAQNGLPPVRPAHTLMRGCSRYAHVLASHSLFRHARLAPRGGFRQLGEILGLASGPATSVDGIVQAWLHSPEHRPILLGRSFGYVGIGVGHGPMNGVRSTFWVVRFGAR